jgi:carbamoyltransferase
VALNSVANERIIRESGFRNVYIMPAAEDSGTAIGAAYHGLWQLTRHNSQRRILHDSPGRTYSPADISAALDQAADVSVVSSTNVISDAVQLLCDGKIIGWFDGGSELGPRALGQRSILCDPRRSDAKETLNRRVKMREAFRPFAPAVLLEEAANWFEFGDTTLESPFMLRVCEVKRERRAEVPAVVHVDGTGRLQTLTRENNGRFYELVKEFYEKTGVPILLNTSFNRMGQPIIETPADAIACLLNTGLDCCVFEDRIVTKTQKEHK